MHMGLMTWVLAQAPLYGFTVSQASSLLLRLKAANILKLTFISDDLDVSHLPAWVKTAKQTTDGHLAQLAKRMVQFLRPLIEEFLGHS